MTTAYRCSDLKSRIALWGEYVRDYAHHPDKIAHIGSLITEQANPTTQQFSQAAQAGAGEDAIAMALEVECDALRALLKQTDQLEVIFALANATHKAGHKIYLVGAGASGRLALLMEQNLQNQITAVLAGGDVTLINALPTFEDDPDSARIQLKLQGFASGDALIGLSASGSASFVLSAVQEAAVQSPGRAVLLSCNDVSAVKQSARQLGRTRLFDDDFEGEFTVVSLKTPPPVLAGSTRMHPTTIMALALLNVARVFDAGIDLVSEIESLMKALSAPEHPTALSKLSAFEASVYKAKGHMLYHVDAASPLTVLTVYQDLTERFPTFNLPRDGVPPKVPAPWSKLQVDGQLWHQFLGGRVPVCLNHKHFPETTPEYLAQCDFSQSGIEVWQKLVGPETVQSLTITQRKGALGFVWKGESITLNTTGLSPFIQLLFLKVILNAHSTTVMARLGLCHGNLMTNVSPSNIKLLARARAMVDTLLVDKAIDSERVHQALCDSFLSLQPSESVIQKTIERCDTMMAVVSDTPALYVGSMTGTSMDGLDVALIRTDGKDHVQPLAHVFVPYKPDFQKALKSIEAAAQKSQGDMARVREQCDVDAIITQQAELHIQAVKQLLQQSGHQPEDIKAHGAHGQTVYHEGAILTVQLINAERIAAQTGIPVVHNFRSRDIALGGQGAPLAPVYHVALAKEHRLIPVVFVNCGGISNVTVITSERFEDVTAFDCGPGNVLLDKFVKAKTDGQHQMDKDGTFALAGTANVDMLVKLQACSCRVGGQNYFDLPAPKSLCSHHFTFPEGFDALSLEDGCATLAAFTANIIIESVPENAGLATWVLGGGGWKNPAIRAALDSALEKRFGRVAVKLADEVGLESDALEAGMCAYLAARVGRPISMPKTTGVPWPLAGALITFP